MIISEFISDKEKYLSTLKEEWLASSDAFPDFLSEIPKDTKQTNEQYIQKISYGMKNQIKKYKRIPVVRKRWCRKTLNLINDVLYHEEILGMHNYMSPLETDAFCGELKEFFRQARKFAPELSFADIGQAIRNYIVYLMFKKINRIDTGFNLAGFGYSMLYPFTDNYIDDKLLTSRDKEAYNQLIRDKIEGRNVHPQSPHQYQTCQLLSYIEDLYPRERDTTVYLLLLMMLDAQEISIRQQNKELPLSYSERLDISVYKGGISVLMDRFLLNKEITKADLNFYLGFGFFLQLADDLQDIKEDSLLGHSNLFTMDLSCKEEERIVNKLLHYVHTITESYAAEDNHMKEFLLYNSYQLIFSSIIRSSEYFSDQYLDKIEKYLPVTIRYMEDLLNNRIENKDGEIQIKYRNILDELTKQDELASQFTCHE